MRQSEVWHRHCDVSLLLMTWWLCQKVNHLLWPSSECRQLKPWKLTKIIAKGGPLYLLWYNVYSITLPFKLDFLLIIKMDEFFIYSWWKFLIKYRIYMHCQSKVDNEKSIIYLLQILKCAPIKFKYSQVP